MVVPRSPRRPLDLSHLRTFVAVYRHGTLTHAAETLGLSQPAVSQHVKALETAMGQDLFLRLPRGVAPTPAAHALAREVTGPIDALEITAQTMPGDADGPARLRVGGPAWLVAPPVVSALATLSSRLDRLTVETGDESTLHDRLRAGDLDLAVGYHAPRDDELRAELLFDEEVSLVAGRGWSGQIDVPAVAPAGLERVASMPWVVNADGPDVADRWRAAVLDGVAAPSAAVVAADVRGVVDAVVAGAGVAALPRHVVVAGIATGHLVELRHAGSTSVFVVTAARPDRWAGIAADLLHRAAPSWNGERVVAL